MTSRHRPLVRRRAPLVVAVLAVASLAACGSDGGADAAANQDFSDWDAVVKAAEEEGTVNFYTAFNENVVAKIVDGFGKAYPNIKVVPNRKTSSLLLQQFESEQRGGIQSADLVTTSSPSQIRDGCSKGTFTEVADDITADDEHKWPEESFDGCAVIASTAFYQIWWNTELLTEAERPKSWEDLLDPRFAGKKMMINSPAITNSYVWMMTVAKDELGDDFLKKLGEQEPVWSESSEQAEQRVGAGEALVSLGGTKDGGQALIDKGLPIEGFTPDPCMGTERTAGVVTNAPHPNAARLLLNWLMTPDGQAAAAEGVASALDNVPGTEPMPDCFVHEDPARSAPNSENGLAVRELLGAP
ncbi:ABC transporter substrate-binding protein [Actinophytocola sp.]|uniref:ABC transporter substrate-binding protein n=1 Tax=Actinophytocola sp. TaxID=1872138 RepID=UPI003D6BEAF1